MSGIFGVFDRKGIPVDASTTASMLEACSYWMPDDRDVKQRGAVVLGHTMLYNTPESRHEHLPLARDTLLLTMDARIDNRAELLTQLTLPDRPAEEIGDSEFILAAYQKWGSRCPQYLLGDFAFVIWDGEKEQLFCARDPIGVKPFYYYLTDDLFVFCNDMKGLLAYEGVPKAFCDEAAAIYLEKGELWHPTLTFFEAVKKLPPATTLTVTAASVAFHTYWELDAIPQNKPGTFEAYREKLLALLEDAVRVRLRTQYPVASHLSGGLDSSTISVLAARQLAPRGEKLKAYSWIEPPREADDASHYEWANSRQIARMEKMDLEHIDLDGKMLSEILMHHNIGLNDTVDLWYEFVLRRSAQQQQIRTVLSGWGGDEFISYHGRAIYADLFRRGKVYKAVKGIWRECTRAKRRLRCFLGRCYRELFLPLLPRRILCHMPKVDCRFDGYVQFARKDFARYVRKRSMPSVFVFHKSIRADQRFFHRQGHILARLESWAASAFENRLEYSFPLLDRRIVEFALSLPAELYYREDQTRFLFRQAVAGLLPKEICFGSFKYEPNRIKRILESEKESFTYLFKVFSANEGCDRNSPYIDSAKLLEGMENFINRDSTFNNEDIKILNEIEKTILLFLLANH
ncbi:asparagine synthase-related protein [Thiomicrolovo sp. ZZH C-3]